MAPTSYQRRETSLKSATRLRLRQLDAERETLLRAWPELRVGDHPDRARAVGQYSRRADRRAIRGSGE
jgi:hypothetical protein